MSVAENPLRSPLTWYGGKGLLAHRLLPLFPPHVTYVEPFAGGASVLFAKPRSGIEVLNDVHDGVVTLYRVLRDPALSDEFVRLCQLTPDARVTYEQCRDGWAQQETEVGRAWAFFVLCRQSFSAHISPSASPTWGYSVVDPGGSHARRWLSAVDGLEAVHHRLRMVQIEHRDWRPILATYDAPGTLFYVDPPYPLATRAGGRRYDHELSHGDHAELTSCLLTLGGMVALSGYRVAELHAPLEEAGWQRTDLEVAVASAKERDGMRRTESLWRNPAALRAWEAAHYPLFSVAGSGEGVAR